MRRALVTWCAGLLALLLSAAGCSSGGDLSRPETQRQFGVRMAKMNLWREAMFRFQREVEIDPQNAMARNNLAVAAEATGDFELAAREYREALRLDRSNQHIQRNYSRFVEFTQKSRKKESASAAATPAPAERAMVPAKPAPDAPAEPPPAEVTTTDPPPGGAS